MDESSHGGLPGLPTWQSHEDALSATQSKDIAADVLACFYKLMKTMKCSTKWLATTKCASEDVQAAYTSIVQAVDAICDALQEMRAEPREGQLN